MNALEIIIRAKDATGSTFRNLEGRVKGISRAWTGLTRLFTGGLIGGAIAGTIKKMVQLSDAGPTVEKAWKSSMRSMNTLLGEMGNRIAPLAEAFAKMFGKVADAALAASGRISNSWFGKRLRGTVAYLTALGSGSTQEEASAIMESEMGRRDDWSGSGAKGGYGKGGKQTQEEWDTYREKRNARWKMLGKLHNEEVAERKRLAKRSVEQETEAAINAEEEAQNKIAAARSAAMKAANDREEKEKTRTGEQASSVAEHYYRLVMDPAYRQSTGAKNRANAQAGRRFNRILEHAKEKQQMIALGFERHLTKREQWALKAEANAAKSPEANLLEQIRDRLAVP